MVNVIGLSGGKDSVALWLWAKRGGLNPIAVYCDTRFEWGGHYKHLDLLEARIGPIIRIARHESFLEATRRHRMFPSRVKKWCSGELKMEPFRDWLNAYREREQTDAVQLLLGYRRQESKDRADMVEREWSDFYKIDVWRPILDWSIDDVIAEHRRAAIPMHPLYHAGAERVGCFPCVNAPKAELRLVSEMAPERVDEIREVEREIGRTMFTRDRRSEKRALVRSGVPVEQAGPSVVPISIDEVMAWACTKHGGKEIQLERPKTGCARWGSCEMPRTEDDE